MTGEERGSSLSYIPGITLFLKVKALLSFNLVFLLDNNITAVLLFVAAAAVAHVFVDLEVHSEGGGKKTRLF